MQLFDDGTKLLRAESVHEACAKFAESQKLDPQLGTLLNLATCHERDGRLATAWTEYAELADSASKKKDQKRAAYAKKKVAELAPVRPRLQLTVPSGVNELKLDGIVLGQAAWNAVLPIDPGDHVVEYAAPAKKPGNQHVIATKGQTTQAVLPPLEDDAAPAPAVVVVVPAATPTPTPLTVPAPAPDQSAPEPAPARSSTLKTVGYVVGAVGIAGLGAGGIFGGIALGDKSTVDHDCIGNQCNQAGLHAVDSARRDATISTVSFIAGGACLAAGVTMVVVGGKKTVQPRVGIAPYATGVGGGGLIAAGTF